MSLKSWKCQKCNFIFYVNALVNYVCTESALFNYQCIYRFVKAFLNIL